MLFRTGIGRIEDRKMDEHTVLSEGIAIEAKEKFLHYDFRDLTYYIAKLNWYATREMQDYFNYLQENRENYLNNIKIKQLRKNKFGIYYRFPMFIRSWLLFLYVYVFKMGFLDGKEGYLYYYLYHRWYRHLVDAKIYEQLKTNRPFEETGDLKA